jgi:OOP family OmpA-OmpF porin
MISARTRSRAEAAEGGNVPRQHLGFVTGSIAAAAFAVLSGCASQSAPPPPPAPAPAASSSTPPAPEPRVQAPTQQVAPAASATPAPPKRCDASVTLTNDEVFAFMKADLTPAAKARLDRDVVGKLGGCARVEAVVIEGHADRLGTQQFNQKLSEQRAEAVKAYIAGKGAPRDAIETIGMGKTVPAKFCPDTKDRGQLIACLAPNRRAIVTIKGLGK